MIGAVGDCRGEVRRTGGGRVPPIPDALSVNPTGSQPPLILQVFPPAPPFAPSV